MKEKLQTWIKNTLSLESEATLVHPSHLSLGDFTFITEAGSAKEEIVKLEENKIPEIDKLDLVNGRFINIFLSKAFFEESLSEILNKKEDFGNNNILEGEKIFFEHSQPNPFKEFHIGHLMNNTLGESISRILKANGAELKLSTYNGDVGLHIAKAIWGMQNNPELQNSPGAAYAMGSKAYEESKDVQEEILLINKKVYDRSEKQINELYDKGRESSFEAFESLYKRLDSNFDFNFYESESGEIGKKLVLENLGKIFEESEGAVVFKGENFIPKTHTRVFLSSEKLPTYEAKELGLAKIKKEKWPYTTSVTVTANEQDSFFKVVEVAIGEVFPELQGRLKHVSHGVLKLPTGKMSSRTGDIISAEDLIDEVKLKIKEKIKDRNFSEEEKDNISEMVAIGAIKYTILRQSVGGDIIFDFDKSISFEGDSGPYLQYTVVRAKSILEKVGSLNIKFETGEIKTPEGWTLTDLERTLYRFPEIVERTGREYSPHHLVNYLTLLASSFNSFYAQNKIIDESDASSPYKIALSQAISLILTNGLTLLGIKVPERM